MKDGRQWRANDVYSTGSGPCCSTKSLVFMGDRSWGSAAVRKHEIRWTSCSSDEARGSLKTGVNGQSEEGKNKEKYLQFVETN